MVINEIYIQLFHILILFMLKVNFGCLSLSFLLCCDNYIMYTNIYIDDY